jgi:hypothetical protein
VLAELLKRLSRSDPADPGDKSLQLTPDAATYHGDIVAFLELTKQMLEREERLAEIRLRRFEDAPPGYKGFVTRLMGRMAIFFGGMSQSRVAKLSQVSEIAGEISRRATRAAELIEHAIKS